MFSVFTERFFFDRGIFVSRDKTLVDTLSVCIFTLLLYFLEEVVLARELSVKDILSASSVKSETSPVLQDVSC
jgi:hypothetical protein